MKRFLRYVADRSLREPNEYLNEYMIGLQVYDRDETFDPRLDSIVRVDAARLRSKLRDYYDSEGRASRIRIEIPKGSYKAIFKKRGRPYPPTSDQGSLKETSDAKTIAVLAFADLSPERNQEYFGDGIAEELMFALSRVPKLRVVAQTSVFAFKGKALDIREI